MATEEPGIKPVVLYVNGEAVSTLNPLPATGGGGGGGGGIVDQGVGSNQDFTQLDLRMEPGDVLAIAIRTASSTATIGASVNWHED